MARNMKMELLTFSLIILYQSKNCGHRIHVLFMMYDVYWYCQVKKKRMIMKILKKEWFISKQRIVEKRGEEETKSMSNAPVGVVYSIQHYMVKFVSDLRLVGGFLRVLRFPPPPFFQNFHINHSFFQNFHNHSFFLHLTISVDVIHHE